MTLRNTVLPAPALCTLVCLLLCWPALCYWLICSDVTIDLFSFHKSGIAVWHQRVYVSCLWSGCLWLSCFDIRGGFKVFSSSTRRTLQGTRHHLTLNSEEKKLDSVTLTWSVFTAWVDLQNSVDAVRLSVLQALSQKKTTHAIYKRWNLFTRTRFFLKQLPLGLD